MVADADLLASLHVACLYLGLLNGLAHRSPSLALFVPGSVTALRGDLPGKGAL
jgi:hypothetical protein